MTSPDETVESTTQIAGAETTRRGIYSSVYPARVIPTTNPGFYDGLTLNPAPILAANEFYANVKKALNLQKALGPTPLASPQNPGAIAASLMRLKTGMSVAGIVGSTAHTVEAVRQGDVMGTIYNGASTFTGTASTASGIMQIAGRTVPSVFGAPLAAANVAVYAIGGVDRIIHAEGPFITGDGDGGHKLGPRGQATAEFAITSAFAIGMTRLGARSISTAVALSGLEGIYTVQRHQREQSDQIDAQTESGRPERIGAADDRDQAPSLYRFGHLGRALTDVSHLMRDSHLTTPLTRGNDGRFDGNEALKLDMRDPKNIAELEHALDTAIDLRQRSAYSSFSPRERISHLTVDGLGAAKAELKMYREDLKAWQELHPDGAQSRFLDGAAPQPGAAGATDNSSGVASPTKAASTSTAQKPPRTPSGHL